MFPRRRIFEGVGRKREVQRMKRVFPPHFFNHTFTASRIEELDLPDNLNHP